MSLQGEPYLVGNERVRLANVIPNGGAVQFALPGFTPRLSAMQGSGSREVVAALDTLVFIPGRSLFYIVWRSVLSIQTQDASDVSDVRIEYLALPNAADPQLGLMHAGARGQ